MATDIDIIKAVFESITKAFANDLNSINELALRQGSIKALEPANKQPMPDAREALAVFSRMEGPGWLQDAGEPVIFQGDAEQFKAWLARLPRESVWPVAGERVSADGQRSLHLRRTPDGWRVTELETDGSGEGIVLTHRLLTVNLQQRLVYEVAYTLENIGDHQDIGDHQEYRPTASRFLGFEAINKENSAETLTP
jgi:hypothetical protein